MIEKEVYWIEGDGIGKEVWEAGRPVIDAVVDKVYSGTRKLIWKELLAGNKAVQELGSPLPEATLDALRTASLAMKGPLQTPVGTGIRSLNVALRKYLDLYACIRPIQHIPGIESPVKHPEWVDMVIFRENTEDVYMGIEYQAMSPESKKLIDFLHEELDVKELSDEAAIGIKPMTAFCSKRLVRAAIKYAIAKKYDTVTLVHKGNIMKYTEGSFLKWGHELAREEFPEQTCTLDDVQPRKVVIKDCIADAMFQEALLHPANYDVLATPNLIGDFLSDALAAQVGGLGMSPGVNMSDTLAFYEPTHGIAPNIAGKDKANPCGIILCGGMLFDYLGWSEAYTALRTAIKKTIDNKLVTEDLALQIKGASVVGCKQFAELIGENLYI